jgi:methanogenic corrinoid protein MtbC1
MEQSFPPGTLRGAPSDQATGRQEAGRSAALRALPSRRDIPLSPELVQPEAELVNAHILAMHSPAKADTLNSLHECDHPGPLEIAEFAHVAVTEGPRPAMLSIEAWVAGGLSLEAVYLDLLAPAARHLGKLWEDDRCDFTDVTIGLGALHQILRELSPQFRSEVNSDSGNALPSVNSGRRMLLVPASGEQHSLGLMMIADFFARAGWDVTGGETPSGADLFRLVRDQWFDVVGMAVGCDRRLELLAADIRTLRSTSSNPDIRVMLGGPILAAHPEYVGVVGADGMAADARQALEVAERLVAPPAAAPYNEAPAEADDGARC